MGKPYMPLMMGDWIRGTRGMRADVKGVYIGLLIHQYDSGFLPADVEELALIEPEVGKVWVKLKEKFEEFEPGKLRNKKLEEVRAFWSKQSNNGQKGGRPKNCKPKPNPNNNPKTNPKGNHHNNDLDLDNDNGINNDNDLLLEYENWTQQIIDGNDHHFEQMFMKESIPQSPNIQFWIMDHRDLLNRYPKMRPPNQNAFRKSCIKHIRENYKKEPKSNGKFTNAKQQQTAATADYLKNYYSDRANGKQV